MPISFLSFVPNCGEEVHPPKEDIRLFDEMEALDFSRVRVHGYFEGSRLQNYHSTCGY